LRHICFQKKKKKKSTKTNDKDQYIIISIFSAHTRQLTLLAMFVSSRTLVWLIAAGVIWLAALLELSLAARVMHQAGVLSALVTGALTVVCAVLLHDGDKPAAEPRTTIMLWSVRFLYALTALLFAWLVLLAAVQLATHSVDATQFPSACAWSDASSCVRIASDSSVNDNGTVSPVFAVSCDALLDASRRFVLDERGRLVTLNATSFLHATFCSSLMGFVSDFFVLCVNATPLAVQSESRLQFNDLAANLARVDSYFDYLRQWNATLTMETSENQTDLN
jgi:uncharacterized protein (DUF1499 family)